MILFVCNKILQFHLLGEKTDRQKVTIQLWVFSYSLQKPLGSCLCSQLKGTAEVALPHQLLTPWNLSPLGFINGGP